MPNASVYDVHADRPLTDVSVAYLQDPANFVAANVFPSIPVDKMSDTYYEWDRGDFMRDEAKERGDCDESEGSGCDLTTQAFSTTCYAFHKDVGNKKLANADPALGNLREQAATIVAEKMLLKKERDFMSTYFTTGVWTATGSDATPAALWDTATGVPIEDIDAGRSAILSVTGREPNVLLLGYRAWLGIKNNPQMVERVTGTGGTGNPAVVTRQAVAEILELDQILVAKSIYTTSNEGQTDAFSFVADPTDALLVHRADSPGLLTPSAGYSFEWTGVSDGLGETIGTSSFFMPNKKCWRVESEMAWDHKVVGSDLGYYINGAVS